jgi:hypothetical protein
MYVLYKYCTAAIQWRRAIFVLSYIKYVMTIFLGTVTVTGVTGMVVQGIEVPSTISVLFQRLWSWLAT